MTPDQEEKLAICIDELAALKAEFAHMGSVERAMLARIRELEAEVESKDKMVQHFRERIEWIIDAFKRCGTKYENPIHFYSNDPPEREAVRDALQWMVKAGTALQDAYYDINEVRRIIEHRAERCDALVSRKPKSVPTFKIVEAERPE